MGFTNDEPPLAKDLIAAAQKGEVHVGREPEPLVYAQGPLVGSLTLDQKQAWLLLCLVGPYKNAEPDDWDIYRAAHDIRRRLAELLGEV